MTAARLRLGVDFGTSTTIAMLQRPDARVQPLLFDGSPLLSSAVLLGPDGQLHTGRDAAHLARSAPERLEPNPKRRVDDTTVLLGDAEVGVHDLVVAVLGRVAREAGRVAGPVRDVALTHPANWGQGRRAVLVEAARRAGFVNIELVGEPTAAATYFAHTRGGALPPGSCVLVYDLGAGTCDVTLLRRTPTGFEQVASDGLNDVGGLDVDAAVIAFLQATYGELWTSPATRRQLWDDVRSAKEMLSRASGTVVMVPALGREVPLGREQLEGLTRPVLRSTIAMTRALLVESGVGTAAIGGLFLVGGSSRIPLVATMLHETLGIAPVVAEQPELVVAEGSLYVNRMPNAAPPAGAPVSAAPSPVSPVSGVPYPPTRTNPAMPVSSPAFAPAPVSPGTSYPLSPPPPTTAPPAFRPPASAFPPPASAFPPPASAFPPPMPPPAGPMPVVPPPARRGPAPAVLVGLVVVALLVLGGGAFGVKQLLGDDPGTGPAAHGTGPVGSAAVPKNTPGKYDLSKLPENQCEKSDATPFYDVFETETAKPHPVRVPNATVNSSSCSFSRMHTGGTPADQRVGSVMFQAWAYNDLGLAVSGHGQEAESARLAGPNSAVAGLGEEAIIYETPGAGEQGKQQLRLTLSARDSNLRLTVYYNAQRSDTAEWTQKEKNDARDRVVTAAKSTFSQTVAGMAR